MEIRGIGFVGSHTTAHVEMGAFLRDVLGLTPIAIDGVGAELFAASNGDVLAVAPPYEEDGSAGAHDRADRRRSRRRDRRAARRRRRDRRDQRERPLALLPLPDAGREAVRARRGACRPARTSDLAEPEVQLGKGAGLRPVVHELVRATSWKPAFSSTRREPALCSTTVASRGRCRSTSEEEPERRARDAPSPVLLADPVADHPSLVTRPAHAFPTTTPSATIVRSVSSRDCCDSAPSAPRTPPRHGSAPPPSGSSPRRTATRRRAAGRRPRQRGGTRPARADAPTHSRVARKHSVRYGSLSTPSRACSVNRSSTFCSTGARSSSERTAQ